TPVYELDARRDCEAVLQVLAENEDTPWESLAALVELGHVDVDESLAANARLPLQLYKQIEPLLRRRTVGETDLKAISALAFPGEWSYRSLCREPHYRVVWLDNYSSKSRDLEKEPEGAHVYVAEWGGDLIVGDPWRDSDRLDRDLGPLLWIPVVWPRSPDQLHYRGFSHGLTDYESARFLRQSGQSLLASWKEFRRFYLQRYPERLLGHARSLVFAAEERRTALALEAVDEFGLAPAKAARAIGIPVAE